MTSFVDHNIYFPLRVSLTSLKLVGLWPSDDLKGLNRCLYHLYGIAVFTFILGSYVIIQLADMYLIWGDLQLMTGSAFLLFTNIAQAVKIFNIVCRRGRIQAIINSLGEELASETKGEGLKIVKRFERETKWLQGVYYLLTTVTLFGWATSAEKNQLPMRAWYPYNTSLSPAFELTYFHQVFAVMISAALNIAKDTLASCLIAQVSCRVCLLKLQLQNLHEDEKTGPSNYSKVSPEAVRTRLRRCVSAHQQTLATAAELQEWFSGATFAQFLVSLVIICVTALQLALQTKNLVRFVSMATYLLNMVFQVFLYCYPGDQLREESLEIATSAYQSAWYTSSVEVRCSIMILMLRSRRPMQLKAGGYTALSLQSFMAIVKTSYSFFTVLQQVGQQ